MHEEILQPPLGDRTSSTMIGAGNYQQIEIFADLNQGVHKPHCRFRRHVSIQLTHDQEKATPKFGGIIDVGVLIFELLDLIEKLAALVPAPQLNLVRYFGVLGASAGWRPLLIPSEPAADSMAPSLCAYDKNKVPAKNDSSSQSGIHPRRYTWDELLKRAFVDVLICPHCGG